MSTFRGVNVYFSRTEDFIVLGLTQLTINWRYIAAHVINAAPATGRTAISELTQISPGECLQLDGDKMTTSFYWNPCSVSQVDVLEDSAEAVRLTRSAVKSCVQAMASTHNSIIHMLSGGLDSSVVAACLSEAPTKPRVACVNQYSKGSNSDERHYARLVSRHVGYPLIEIERNPDVDLEGMLNAPRTAQPFSDVLSYCFSTAFRQVAAEQAATAQFTGGLGDLVFLHSPIHLAAADYRILHGLRRDILRVALDIALIERTWIGAVLASAWRYGHIPAGGSNDFFRTVMKQIPGKRKLVNPDAFGSFDDEDSLLHPWISQSSNVPPCKLVQIMCLAKIAMEAPHARPDDPHVIHAFAAQPIVELGLRFRPTSISEAAGIDQLFARPWSVMFPRSFFGEYQRAGWRSLGRQSSYATCP